MTETIIKVDDQVSIITGGPEGKPGLLAPEDRDLVQRSIAAAQGLEDALAQVTLSAQMADQSADEALEAATQANSSLEQIRTMTVATGEPGSDVAWDGTTLTVPAGVPGGPGEPGLQGPPGPRPSHQWTGTALAFEKPDGSMGTAVDLRGAAGTSATITVVTTQAAFDAATPGPAELVVLV